MSTTIAEKLAAEIPNTDLAHFQITRGRFTAKKVETLLHKLYSVQEVEEMKAAGVDKRMIFGMNPHYLALVLGGGLNDEITGKEILPDMPASRALLALVMPRLGESFDLSGEVDPSNQNRYAGALKGKLLHKYDEIVLAYSALACSAHCRYCYRLDLFNGSTGKSLVKPEELRAYVTAYNTALKEISLRTGQNYSGPTDVTKEDLEKYPLLKQRASFEHDIAQNQTYVFFPVTEVLMSGGDPMVLTNHKLYEYMSAAAAADVSIVRIGTKEMAFRPERFDDSFAETLRIFNEKYPNVHVNIITHFSHPDEFLERTRKGQYIRQKNGYKWLRVVEDAAMRMTALPFVSLENQTPMIDHVNNDAQALHILHQELRRKNVKPKYIFQCREIEGHKAFAVPVEEAWRIHTESQKGVSDTARSRFAMSSEWGKLEIISVVDGMPDEISSVLPENLRSALQDGFIIFKVHRSPYSAETQSDIVIARRNPEALWISGYEDRLIYDGRKRGAERFRTLVTLMTAIAAADAAGSFANSSGIADVAVIAH
ncbi:MAG TPA: hypothetical protein VH593_10270 [Ktedonobacteraceae bacterium]